MWPTAMKFGVYSKMCHIAAITGVTLSFSHHGAVQSGIASGVGKCLMNNSRGGVVKFVCIYTSIQIPIHFTIIKYLQNATYK